MKAIKKLHKNELFIEILSIKYPDESQFQRIDSKTRSLIPFTGSQIFPAQKLEAIINELSETKYPVRVLIKYKFPFTFNNIIVSNLMSLNNISSAPEYTTILFFYYYLSWSINVTNFLDSGDLLLPFLDLVLNRSPIIHIPNLQQICFSAYYYVYMDIIDNEKAFSVPQFLTPYMVQLASFIQQSTLDSAFPPFIYKLFLSSIPILFKDNPPLSGNNSMFVKFLINILKQDAKAFPSRYLSKIILSLSYYFQIFDNSVYDLLFISWDYLGDHRKSIACIIESFPELIVNKLLSLPGNDEYHFKIHKSIYLKNVSKRDTSLITNDVSTSFQSLSPFDFPFCLPLSSFIQNNIFYILEHITKIVKDTQPQSYLFLWEKVLSQSKIDKAKILEIFGCYLYSISQLHDFISSNHWENLIISEIYQPGMPSFFNQDSSYPFLFNIRHEFITNVVLSNSDSLIVILGKFRYYPEMYTDLIIHFHPNVYIKKQLTFESLFSRGEVSQNQIIIILSSLLKVYFLYNSLADKSNLKQDTIKMCKNSSTIILSTFISMINVPIIQSVFLLNNELIRHFLKLANQRKTRKLVLSFFEKYFFDCYSGNVKNTVTEVITSFLSNTLESSFTLEISQATLFAFLSDICNFLIPVSSILNTFLESFLTTLFSHLSDKLNTDSNDLINCENEPQTSPSTLDNDSNFYQHSLFNALVNLEISCTYWRNISTFEFSVLANLIVKLYSKSVPDVLYSFFIKMLAKQDLNDLRPHFIIRQPHIISVMLNVSTFPSDITRIICLLKELCSYSRTNAELCQKGEIDKLLANYLYEHKNDELTPENKHMYNEYLTLFEDIAKVACSSTAVQLFIKALCPKNGILSNFHETLIESLQRILSDGKFSNVEMFPLCNEGKIIFSKIPPLYLKEGFTISFWVFITEPPDNSIVPIISLSDRTSDTSKDNKKKTHQNKENDEDYNIIEIFFKNGSIQLIAEKNHKRQSCHFPMIPLNSWQFFTIFIQPIPSTQKTRITSLLNIKKDHNDTGFAVFNSRIDFLHPITVQIGGETKLEGMYNCRNNFMNSVYNLGQIGLYFPFTEKEVYSIYDLGPNKCQYMLDPILFTSPCGQNNGSILMTTYVKKLNDDEKISIHVVSPKSIHERSFVEVFLHVYGITSLLPVFTFSTLSTYNSQTDVFDFNSKKTQNFINEKFLQILKSALLLDFQAEDSFSQADGFRSLVHLLKQCPEAINYKNYLILYEIFEHMNSAKGKEDLFDILSDYIIWFSANENEKFLILRHWVWSLFPCNISLSTKKFSISAIFIIIYNYFYKHDQINSTAKEVKQIPRMSVQMKKPLTLIDHRNQSTDLGHHSTFFDNIRCLSHNDFSLPKLFLPTSQNNSPEINKKMKNDMYTIAYILAVNAPQKHITPSDIKMIAYILKTAPKEMILESLKFFQELCFDSRFVPAMTTLFNEFIHFSSFLEIPDEDISIAYISFFNSLYKKYFSCFNPEELDLEQLIIVQNLSQTLCTEKFMNKLIPFIKDSPLTLTLCSMLASYFQKLSDIGELDYNFSANDFFKKLSDIQIPPEIFSNSRSWAIWPCYIIIMKGPNQTENIIEFLLNCGISNWAVCAQSLDIISRVLEKDPELPLYHFLMKAFLLFQTKFQSTNSANEFLVLSFDFILVHHINPIETFSPELQEHFSKSIFSNKSIVKFSNPSNGKPKFAPKNPVRKSDVQFAKIISSEKSSAFPVMAHITKNELLIEPFQYKVSTFSKKRDDIEISLRRDSNGNILHFDLIQNVISVAKAVESDVYEKYPQLIDYVYIVCSFLYQQDPTLAFNIAHTFPETPGSNFFYYHQVCYQLSHPNEKIVNRIPIESIDATKMKLGCEYLATIFDSRSSSNSKTNHELSSQTKSLLERIYHLNLYRTLNAIEAKTRIFHTSCERSWQKLWRQLTSERAPWESSIEESELPGNHYKRSKILCSQLYPANLRHNFHFTDHKRESVLRDTGSSQRTNDIMSKIELQLQEKKNKSKTQNGLLAAPDFHEDQDDEKPKQQEINPDEKEFYERECEIIKISKISPAILTLYPNEARLRNTETDYLYIIDYSMIKMILLRTICHRKTAIEIFMESGQTYFLDFSIQPEKDSDWATQKSTSFSFSSSKKNISIGLEVIKQFQTKVPPTKLQQLDFKKYFESQSITKKWQENQMTNFDYLLKLNIYSGRSFSDPSQYPIFPWIYVNFDSPFDTTNPKNFRELKKPIGAMSEERLSILENNRDTKDSSLNFLYSAGPSSPLLIFIYLIREEPMTTMHILSQGGQFDNPSRQFYSIPVLWNSVCTYTNDYRELTPEFYYSPEFLLNLNNFDLGSIKVNEKDYSINSVELPNWVEGNTPFQRAYDFVYKNRKALESDFVSQNLPKWIDLLFGCKQNSSEDKNVYMSLFYPNIWETELGKDPLYQQQIETMLKEVGQIPQTLFSSPHPQRHSMKNSFSFDNSILKKIKIINEPMVASFYNIKKFGFGFITETNVLQYKKIKITNSGITPVNKSQFSISNISMKLKLDNKNLRTVLDQHNIVCVGTLTNELFMIPFKQEKKKGKTEPSTITLVLRLTDGITTVVSDGKYFAVSDTDSFTYFYQRDSHTNCFNLKKDPQFFVQTYKDPFICSAISTNFRTFVGGTSEGSLIFISLHTRRTEKIVSLQNRTARNILITPKWGFVVIHADSNEIEKPMHFILLYSINGEFIREITIQSPVKTWISSSSPKKFDIVGMILENNSVYLFEAFYLKIGKPLLPFDDTKNHNVESYESIALFKKEGILLILTSFGNIIPCQINCSIFDN